VVAQLIQAVQIRYLVLLHLLVAVLVVIIILVGLLVDLVVEAEVQMVTLLLLVQVELAIHPLFLHLKEIMVEQRQLTQQDN
jgi:hypothetical protein